MTCFYSLSFEETNIHSFFLIINQASLHWTSQKCLNLFRRERAEISSMEPLIRSVRIFLVSGSDHIPCSVIQWYIPPSSQDYVSRRLLLLQDHANYMGIHTITKCLAANLTTMLSRLWREDHGLLQILQKGFLISTFIVILLLLNS